MHHRGVAPFIRLELVHSDDDPLSRLDFTLEHIGAPSDLLLHESLLHCHDSPAHCIDPVYQLRGKPFRLQCQRFYVKRTGQRIHRIGCPALEAYDLLRAQRDLCSGFRG